VTTSTFADSASARLGRAPVAVILQQHVEEVAHLRHVRTITTRAPHVRLLHLARLDERIAAHLDGVAVAGDHGTALCAQALVAPDTGSMFAAAVRAIESRDAQRLRELLAIGRSAPESRRGLLSAFGWVSAASLRGITKALLDADDAWWREVGLAACAMHQVDPGAGAFDRALSAEVEDGALKARALRAVGTLARVEHRDSCLAAARGIDPTIRYEAARAALLLGDRSECLTPLRGLAATASPLRDAALGLLLKLSSPDEALMLLKLPHADPAAIRTLIRAIGVAGDPAYLPWLIARMDDPALARLAGESFSLITGLDLAYLDLERNAVEGRDAGPNDDPADDNVALDEDDGLPWPDPAKLAAWWKAHDARFRSGTRCFMGHPPTTAQCFAVLQTGFQRQRRHAAEYLCLLKPGTPLFNIAAPAWRQQRLLALMSVTDHTP